MLDPLEGLRAALADRYIIDREIGRGGTATVYLAQDRKHTRSVAIKVLAPELALVVRTERFLREILIAARLQHPHILPLHDSGEAGGLLYYVMPFVSGETLRDRLAREGRLPVQDAVRITQQVASALAYAHEQGVVHRDIKPGNILLSAGEAIVADFGIARAIKVAEAEGFHDGVTETGISVGTPAYMSPEQAAGESNLDGRTDIYSLGCVLYEMLAGCPPFQGPTVQAVIAQHMVDRPPALRRSRADVPAGMERVLDRALAKDPDERFRTAREFGDAVASPDTLPPRPWSRKKKLRLALGAGLVLATIGVWRVAGSRSLSLDANKIVVFPLVERGTTADDKGVGERVALIIGSALEHTEPLRWIDGWTWLRPAERTDITLLSATEARDIARGRGARYYIDGSLLRSPDSTTVILRLNDAAGDSLITQASTTGGAAEPSPAQLGLQGVTQLLPRLVEPRRRVDLSALTARRPAAVANWLQGEREYRQSHFAGALQYLRRAVRDDSALALAALRGAEAADWEQLETEALQLVDLALVHANLLPPKYGEFAHGLRAYFTGAADSAVAHFGRALAADSQWSAAWTSLGEVYYHLLPRAAPLDSLAEAAFLRAQRVDPDFAVPLHHLAEMALRAGDVRRAERLIETFRRWAPDSTWMIELRIMLDCVRNGPGRVDWPEAASRHPWEVVAAANALGWATGSLGCAERGFAAVLAVATAHPHLRWGALFGLQSVLVAQGRTDPARQLLDSALSSGERSALGVYLIDALAGAGMSEQAAKAASIIGDRYEVIASRGLWYRGRWAAHNGATEQVDAIVRVLTKRVKSSGDGNEQVWVEALGAYLALARGDTATAIVRFRKLTPRGTRVDLAWGLWEPLAGERMKLAELLLARREYAEAERVADGFDHARPITFLLYAQPSLELRLHAAEGMNRSDRVAHYRARLSALAGRRGSEGL